MSKRQNDGNGFEDWGGYMNAKKQKLHEQCKKKASYESLLDEEESSEIFKGVAIYVNGYTIPTSDDLKRLILLHGGAYHHYYRHNHTTHIIATNLPDSKIRNLRDEKVVRPDWIVDSVKAGKQLPCTKYLLYFPRLLKGQQSLQFKLSEDKKDEPTGSKTDIADNTSDFHSMLQSDQEHIQQKASSLSMKSASIPSLTSTSPTLPSNIPVLSLSTLNCIQNQLSPVHHAPSDGEDQKSRTALTARDPNFISEFYNHSRLHHISTAKLELRAYVQHLVSSHDGTFPKRRELLKRVNPICNGGNEFSRTTVNSKQKVIMHIDMDCFFVSVGLRNKPELQGKPVAVTHSKTGRGRSQPGSNAAYEMQQWKRHKLNTSKASNAIPEIDVGDESESVAYDSLSEVASCSYEARKAGLHNGMMVGQALQLCPDLQFIPYDFEAYSEVSKSLYDTVASYTLDIEAVSCDELYVDATEVLTDTGLSALEFATCLRQDIRAKTGCTASIGIGSNFLIARLATKVAKPNGQHFVFPEKIQEFMVSQKVTDLPGVGYSVSARLKAMNVEKCEELQKLSLSVLQKEFGPKSGKALYDHCRGIDSRILKTDQERKSVSAEVNYGIRFQEQKEAENFLVELSKEVQQRLRHGRHIGRVVTLKVKVRHKGAPIETAKFLGHGICDNITRSSKLWEPTDDFNIISRECISLYHQMQVKFSDLRGVGIQVTQLEVIKNVKNVPKQATLNLFATGTASAIFSEMAKGVETKESGNGKQLEETLAVPGTSKQTYILPATKGENLDVNLPSPSQIDPEILESLPDEIQKQIAEEYKRRGYSWFEEPNANPANIGTERPKGNNTTSHALPNLSQLDPDVLEELPEDVRKEVLEMYENRPKKTTSASPSPKKKMGRQTKYSPRKQIAKQSPLKDTTRNQRTIIDHFTKENVLKEERKNTLSKSERQTKASLCGASTLEEVKKLITEWVDSSDAPLDDDIDMFLGFMCNIFSERDLEKLDLILKHFYRQVKDCQNPCWRKAYLAAINEIQIKMLLVYGSPLKVNTNF